MLRTTITTDGFDEVKFSECIAYIIKFHNASLAYNKIVNKVSENQFLRKTTIEHIHEAMLLKQITEWEQFTINLLSFSIAQDTAKICRFLNIKLPKRISTDNAHAIINGLNAFSMGSATKLTKVASKLISPKCNPFSQLTKYTLGQIDEAILIRNYIAHKSKSSRHKLLLHYKKVYKIREFIEPGAFLTENRQTRMGPFNSSAWYAWIFMTFAIMSWRLLDRSSYNEIYTSESKDGNAMGMVRMNIIFERLTEKYNLSSY